MSVPSLNKISSVAGNGRTTLVPSPLVFAAGLATAQLCLCAVAVALGAPRLIWLVGHVLLITAGVTLLWRQRTGIADMSAYVLALIATFAAGPFGAVLSVGALALIARERLEPTLLADWYHRIALSGDVDAVTDLYNTVAMGRAVRTSVTLPPVFEYVMRDGSLEDRQTALGLIARQFSPSYAPALKLALVSPEPVIRVQAAAVAVKVRAELKTTLAATLLQSARADLTPAEVVACALQLQAIATSGLLEDEDCDRGMNCLETLLTRAAADVVPADQEPYHPDAVTQAMLETHLLRQGNFAALRAIRGQPVARASNSRSPLETGK